MELFVLSKRMDTSKHYIYMSLVTAEVIHLTTYVVGRISRCYTDDVSGQVQLVVVVVVVVGGGGSRYVIIFLYVQFWIRLAAVRYRGKEVQTGASPVMRSVNKSRDTRNCFQNEPE